MLLLPLLAAAALSAAPGAARAGDVEERPRRILALHALEPGVPADAIFTTAFRSALPRGSGLELYAEHIDRIRFPEPGYAEAFRAWLLSKYARHPPDVIIAIGEDAIEFLADPARTPFAGVPVVYGLVDGRVMGPTRLPPSFTGVTEHYAVQETLALARRLFPATRHVALVGGAGPADLTMFELLRSQVAEARTGLDVIDLHGLTMPDLQARLRALPPDTVLLGVSFYQDATGRLWAGPQSVPAIVAASTAPLFTPHAHLIGTGTIGGVMADYGESGKAAAATALRILGGEKVQDIPTRPVGANRALLDGRQLARWGVDDALVPADAEVRLREPKPWIRYRVEVALVLTGFFLQSVLIGLLLVERRRRWAAEARARENLGVVAHMNRVSAFGELVGSLAHELNSPLGAVLSNAQAGLRLLGDGKAADDAEVRGCLADIVRDVKRASEVIRRIRGALRKDTWTPVDLDVHALVREAFRLVKADARDKGVTVHVQVPPGLPPVHGDEVQLVQVILNLLVNAIDAVAGMPEDRRLVRITADVDGGRVAIRVVDSGPGLPPDAGDRLFEPFFTTKPFGLGMGLSISRSIVESHGGSITAGAAPDGGAAFEVRLPAARGASGAPRAHAVG